MSPEPAPGGEAEALPRRLGPYVLFDRIGEGGMARIYLAREQAGLLSGRRVVVKEILPLLSASPEMSQLLVAEAKLCAALTHRNVVQVFDLGRADGQLYIAMEYVEGLDLRDLLRGCSRRKLALPVEYSLLVVGEALRALDYAHRRRGEDGAPLGIVHRDVSPSNLLLSIEGEVKLCDFGIARVLAADESLPDEAIQGKAGYMSPEAARGDPADARSDVFAAGIVLWELLAGQRLYRSGAGRPSTLQQAREAFIPPLPARDLPDEERLHGIVQRALARDPAARYPSAGAMLQDLEAYVAAAGLIASSLRFGDWLMEHFGEEIVARRAERERAVAAELVASSVPPPSPAEDRPVAAAPPPVPPAAARSVALPASAPPASSEPIAPGGSGGRGAVIAAVVVLLCLLAGLYLGTR